MTPGGVRKTHTTNLADAFIEVADDCPADSGVEPPVRTPGTVARAEYEMIMSGPYAHTSDDVIHATRGEPKGIGREEFFSRGQACFRASALAKRYGWGVHSDGEGRIALYAVGSDDYRRLAADPGLSHFKAMRQSRGK